MEIKRLTTAGSVFMLAFATGYVMQNADALASRFGGGDTEISAIPESDSPGNAGFAVRDTGVAGIRVPEEPGVSQLAPPAPTTFGVRLPGEHAMSDATCEVVVSAERRPSAMVALEISAPCHAGKPVTIRHDVLAFLETLPVDGHARFAVPALSPNARFEIEMPDGTTVQTEADVPEADRFQRVALQWKGEARLQLHAFEYGAAHGDPGHVHADAAYSPRRAQLSGAGFLSRLGDDGAPDRQIAEVYSFPSNDGNRSGVVRISVEAEVTEAMCGSEISAEVLRPLFGADLEAMEMAFTMPGCESVGEFLVLNNVLRDMRIASN